MKSKSVKKITFEILALVVFLVGSGLFLSAKNNSTSPNLLRSFTGTWQEVDIDSAGNRTVRQIRVQTTRANGDYTLRTINPRNGNEATFISTNNDIYELGAVSLQFFGPALKRNLPSPSALRVSPGFIREEKVLGINAFVFRVEQGDQWAETYVAPETGNNILKEVRYEGNGEYTIIEPLAIQFRDVSDDEVKLPDLPKRFDRAEKRAGEYLRGGAAEVGQSLKRAIEQRKD